MEKSNAIFSVSKNNNGEVVNTMYKYLDTDEVYETLKKVLTEKRDEFCVDEDMHGWYYDDDAIDEYIWMLVEQFNTDMKNYLHSDSHRIDGNFNNLDYDYNYHKCAIINGHKDNNKIGGHDYELSDCIKRLDSGEDTEDARTDRKALTDWFFDTFGTWGICYNFTEYLSSSYEDYCYYNDIEE